MPQFHKTRVGGSTFFRVSKFSSQLKLKIKWKLKKNT